MPDPAQTPRFFASPGEFRDWLRLHHADSAELLVGFHKRGSGRPSMTWPQSVDEALCIGWIDGVRRRIDDDSYTIRFTPRKARSTWSAKNVASAERLIAEGRMQSTGQAAFDRRTEDNTAIYSFEREQPAAFSPEQERVFRANRAAWRFFERQPPWYRKVAAHRVVSAKREETRARRLARLIDACAAGRRLEG